MGHHVAASGPQFSRERTPPQGWSSPSGVLEPTRTVFGYIARGQTLRGGCFRRDCRRSCTIDLEHLQRRGLDLAEREILHLHRCNRLDGCGLELRPEPHTPNLPLRRLVGVPGIATRIKCRGCEFFRRLTVEEMIGQLVASKRGGDATCVSEVKGLLKSPCKACKKTSWDFDVLWPAENTLGWRNGQRP